MQITAIVTRDVRFPTSRSLAGSDAVHTSPDYSAAYVILKTDHPDGLEGHGLSFTCGRGTELVVAGIHSLAPLVVGRSLDGIVEDFRGFWRALTSDGQLRWTGPEKGVIHLATGAIVNAVWDLFAKSRGKPVWKLLADMTPEETVNLIDFRYIEDALTPDEALDILRKSYATRGQREADLLAHGYPAYITSAGWLGYGDEKLRRLCREAVAEGWTQLKMKVGANIEDDMRRAAIMREEIGPERKLMVDANQAWDVGTAIRHMKRLAPFDPWWIQGAHQPGRRGGA